MPKRRKDYRLPPRPASLSEVGRPEDFVVRFTSPAGVPGRSLDLSAYAHRPRLAAEFAFASRHHLADKAGETRKTFRHNIPYWFRFLDEHDPAREAVRSARDIDTALLAGEPFGPREALGCLLILCAGALEGFAELRAARGPLSALPPARRAGPEPPLAASRARQTRSPSSRDGPSGHS